MTNSARILRFHLFAYGGLLLCIGVAVLSVQMAQHVPLTMSPILRKVAFGALMVVPFAALALWVMNLGRFNKCGGCGAPLTRMPEAAGTETAKPVDRHAPYVYWRACANCGLDRDATAPTQK